MLISKIFNKTYNNLKTTNTSENNNLSFQKLIPAKDLKSGDIVILQSKDPNRKAICTGGAELLNACLVKIEDLTDGKIRFHEIFDQQYQHIDLNSLEKDFEIHIHDHLQKIIEN